MLSWSALGLVIAHIFVLTAACAAIPSVSAFMSSSSGRTHTHEEKHLNTCKLAKRQKLQAGLPSSVEETVQRSCISVKLSADPFTKTSVEEMSGAKARPDDVILRVVESVCNHDGAINLGDEEVWQTIQLLRQLESSAFEHIPADPLTPGAKKSTKGSLMMELAHEAHTAADALRRLMMHYGTSGGKGRKAIKDVAAILTDSDYSSDIARALGSVLTVSALSIGDHGCDDHRGLARAAASGVLPNKPLSDNMHSALAVIAANELLATSIDEKERVDLHIMTSICRSYIEDAPQLRPRCAKVVASIFGLPEDGNVDENTKLPDVAKIEAAAALALSAQIGPWKCLKPSVLVEIATDMNLWSAAERICLSAVDSASTADCEDAVLVLIESAAAAAQYRQMDAYATEFYENGGRQTYAEARLLHAYDTISKVAAKRQFPIIEKQIERIDRAFERVKNDLQDGKKYDDSGPTEARDFAITKLVELGEVEAAHRLASLWGRDFIYDDKELERMAKARKEKYLQWEDTEVGHNRTIPDVLSDSSSFLAEYKEMMSGSDRLPMVVGFDCEFGDEQTKGVALLQLSTITKAILVDVPALAATKEGCKALRSTIGDLFAGDIPVCGFACGEDVRRLRASPSALETHWLGSSSAVVDIKPLIAQHSPQLKHTGLSRACENYLKKPLDKSEQCSLWLSRPLSKNQRAYAALDAFTCAAIYNKLQDKIKNK